MPFLAVQHIGGLVTDSLSDLVNDSNFTFDIQRATLETILTILQF